jgi:hypothetical protein
MTRNQRLSATTRSSNIRAWRYGEFPIPDWMPKHIGKGIEPNGTFALETDLGYVRVHPGNMVIERCGTVWVRPIEEAVAFIESLEASADPTITNIGPGKVRKFGTSVSSKGKAEKRSQQELWSAAEPSTTGRFTTVD